VIGFWQTQSPAPNVSDQLRRTKAACILLVLLLVNLSFVGKSFNFWVPSMDASVLLHKLKSQIHYHCIANVAIMIKFCADEEVMSH
jgi:hypothetical protein